MHPGLCPLGSETPIINDGVFFRHSLFYGDPGEVYMKKQSSAPTTKLLGIYDGADNLTSFDVNSLSAGWHHLAVSSQVGITRFYVDGSMVGSVNDHMLLEIETVGNAHGNSKFSSKLDDFRVYDRTFSAYEVSVLYGNGDGDFGVHPYSDFPPSFDNVPVILPPRNPIVFFGLSMSLMALK